MLDLHDHDQLVGPASLSCSAPGCPDRFARSPRTSAYLCGRVTLGRDDALDDLVDQLDASFLPDADVVDHVGLVLLRAGATGALVVRATAARAVGDPPHADAWTLSLRVGDVEDGVMVALEHGGLSIPGDPDTSVGRILCTVGRDARDAEEGARSIAASHLPLDHAAAQAHVAALVIAGDGVLATPGLRVRTVPGTPPVVVQTRSTA
jgi:hypothetical protein